MLARINVTLFLCLLLGIVGCEKDKPFVENEEQNAVPILDAGSYAVDESLSLIVYNGENIVYDSLIRFRKDTFSIAPQDSELISGKEYSINKGNVSYKLYRTELPLVELNTDSIEIPDEPKIVGNMQLKEKGDDVVTSTIGIERRGGFSQTFPKKSYGIELWNDASGETNRDEALLGMRDDDDWILDGLWNEPLRIRDFTAHDIWLKMGRNDYADEEPETIFGIRRKYCEVFLNGDYRGIYYLGEKVDRKQLKLKDYENNTLRGELYKVADKGHGVLYTELEPFINDSLYWSGYETEYPDDVGEFDWTNLHQFIDLVINSTPASFDARVSKVLNIENAVDYFIFINVLYAADNTQKNIYLAKYDTDSKYNFVAWDMDATFGSNWQGQRLQDTNTILSNPLFDRLLSNDEFVTELKARWNRLKNSTLSAASLNRMLSENYAHLKANGTYERESLDPELPQAYSDTEIDFMTSWVNSRVEFVESYISSL